jgi:hypothetical protein
VPLVEAPVLLEPPPAPLVDALLPPPAPPLLLLLALVLVAALDPPSPLLALLEVLPAGEGAPGALHAIQVHGSKASQHSERVEGSIFSL